MKNKVFSISELTSLLDKEFEMEKNPENLVEFAITDQTREYINPEFLNQTTGLMLKGSEEIKKVYSVVFVTDHILEKLKKEKDCLIFTHHHFNYYEDERGLLALNKNQIEKILDSGKSLYVAHAPLDTHPEYGTSKSLAKLCNIVPGKLFFDYFGAPTALIGQIEPTGFDDFAEFVRTRLARPTLTLHKHHEDVHKIGVVAGGGDMPEILQEVYDNGCDTLLTGTIEHRWNIPFVQEQNKKFHELNKELKLNLIGGTHYGTERPAMFFVKELFDGISLDFEYCEDDDLLHAI